MFKQLLYNYLYDFKRNKPAKGSPHATSSVLPGSWILPLSMINIFNDEASRELTVSNVILGSAILAIYFFILFSSERHGFYPRKINFLLPLSKAGISRLMLKDYYFTCGVHLLISGVPLFLLTIILKSDFICSIAIYLAMVPMCICPYLGRTDMFPVKHSKAINGTYITVMLCSLFLLAFSAVFIIDGGMGYILVAILLVCSFGAIPFCILYMRHIVSEMKKGLDYEVR